MTAPVLRKGFRTYDGKRYDFVLSKRTESEAKRSAAVWRKRGSRVRVTKGRDKKGRVVYTLWAR